MSSRENSFTLSSLESHYFVEITLYVLYMNTSTRQCVNWLPSKFSVFVNNYGALRKGESVDSSPLLTLILAFSATIFTQFTVPLALTLFGKFSDSLET